MNETPAIFIMNGCGRLMALAKMSISGFDELELKLSQLGNKSTEIGKKAVKEGAGILADEVRKNLKKNLEGSKYTTGDLLDSLGVTPADIDKNGVINAKVGFSGYDRKGVANLVKARAMESGTSRQKKKPFLRPAINATKEKIEKIMQKIIDDEIETIVKG